MSTVKYGPALVESKVPKKMGPQYMRVKLELMYVQLGLICLMKFNHT